jgi:FkbM family methyltransferase
VRAQLRRIKEGLAWRLDPYLCKRFLLRTFDNGPELYDSWRNGTACDKAIFRDGMVIRHPPGQSGFAGLIVEIFYRGVYTGSFYQPKANDYVVDAGANIGAFSVQIHRLCPTATVAAYEPFPENFAYLQNNLEQARATNVIANCKALGGGLGETLIFNIGDRSQDHRISEAEGTDSKAKADHGDSVRAELMSFAELIRDANGRRINLLKCDIEGSEWDLFRSAKKDQLEQVDRFAIEFHDNIKPGTSKGLTEILSPTHTVEFRDVSPHGYGMLYGVRKPG